MEKHSYIINSDDLVDLKVALGDLINRYDAIISENKIEDKDSFYHRRKRELIQLNYRSEFNRLKIIHH
jgi:hypothetical protein